MSLRPYCVLFVLWLLYLHPLILHPTQTFVSPYSDFLAEHIPAKLFLNREWRTTGELPLWNPYHFCGSPFVHDIQVGIFYPPNAVALVVPESSIGAAFSWMVALHVLAAGIFAYIYARSRQLNEVGSLVAAIGFMLSSKWMTHLFLAGHTITIGLAWLPLVLLAMEYAIERRRVWAILGAGVALALLGLGTHPQWAFYAGVFALAWTFPTERVKIVRWAACWGGVVVLAVLLAAVQLFPAAEASQWSARSSSVEAPGTLTVGVSSFFRLVGPARGQSIDAWEVQGVFGLFWIAAATAAPLFASTTPRVKIQFGVLCGLVVFAVGGAVLVDWLPGFNLFRSPARMLLVAAFPLAYLAGVATDAITRAEWSHGARLNLSRGFRLTVVFAGLPTVFGLVVFSQGEIWPPFLLYCTALIVSLVLFVRVLQQNAIPASVRTALWLVILLADLLAPTITLPTVQPQTELYPTSPAMEALASRAEAVRVLDWDTGPHEARGSFLGVGAPQSMVYGVASPRGYSPLDVRHYREFIAFVANDNQPIRGDTPYSRQAFPNFEIGNPQLFRLLCVTHRVAPDNALPPPAEWKALLRDEAPPTPPPHLRGISIPLPPHTLSEAVKPQPRAWIVPRAELLTTDSFETLKKNDYSQTVLISSDNALSQPNGTQPGTAKIVEYHPNRVAVELDGTGGWLVLSEVWYPGWTCRVDGVELPVHRANHAFRAVPVSVDAKRAEFVFAPRSYAMGWWVSAITLSVVGLLSAVGMVIHLTKQGA